MMLQGAFGDEGHLKDFTTSLVSPITVEAAVIFHQHRDRGWIPLSGSHCGCLCSALSYRHRACHRQASMTPNRKKAWYTMPGNTQNLMFQSPLWKLDNCPSVSLYVPFMVACSVLLPHMCFFIGCCKLENIINSFGFRDSQFNSRILKWELFFPASSERALLSKSQNRENRVFPLKTRRLLERQSLRVHNDGT